MRNKKEMCQINVTRLFEIENERFLCYFLDKREVVMEWGQVVAIVGTNVALCGFIAGFMLWAVNKLDGDIKSLGDRLEKNVDSLGRRLDGHATRIDQLYQMFIQLVKEKK